MGSLTPCALPSWKQNDSIARRPLVPLSSEDQPVGPHVHASPMLLVRLVPAFIPSSICKVVETVSIHLIAEVLPFVLATTLESRRSPSCTPAFKPVTLVSATVCPGHQPIPCHLVVHIFSLIAPPSLPYHDPPTMLLVLEVVTDVSRSFRPLIHAFPMHLVTLVLAFIPPPILVSEQASTLTTIILPLPHINSAVRPTHPPETCHLPV
mmetsp:Transcript_41986/g.132357  ORF Transcript_41986/g.132357 Transcript_41986/m.132357 type:complete len:208 (-) Transcript_41986:686-1309(-)